MAAIIKIEVSTSGGLEDVKKDVADLGKTAESSGGGFNALKEIGIGALRAIGAAAVDLAAKGLMALAGAVQDGIADAQKNAQIQAQTAAVLKSTGNAAGKTAEQIADYASSLSDAAGTSLFGDDQIQQSTNLLLTFSEIKGATLDAATAISVDMAQAMGGAPKDAAIQLGKALNDPIKGITALTRVGVVFSDEQKAQIQAMQEAGDTAGAQAVILAELNKEFGGSAQAAADATGGWSEFNGRMGEAKEALGAAVLPLLSQLAGVLLTHVVPAIEDLAARFGPFVESLQPVIASITGFIGDLMAGFADTSPLDTFTTASTTLGTFWSTTLKPAFDAVWTVLQTQVMPILNDLAAALFPLVGAAIQVLSGFWTDVLVPALQTFWEFLTTTILPIIAALAGWLKDNLPGAIQAVADFLTTTLFPALHKIYDFISINVIPILAQVAEWLITNVPVAIQKASDFWNNVLWPALQKVWTFIQDKVIPIVTSLVNDTFEVLNTATTEVATFWTETLWPALQKVWAFIQDNVIPLLTSLANGAIDLVKKEVDLLAALWNNVLLPAITAVWQFIQDKIIPIFKTLVETHLAALKKGFQDVSDFWTDTFKPALEALYSYLYNTFNPLLATLNTNVLEPMKGWFDDIAAAVDWLVQKLNDLVAMWESLKPPAWLEGQSPPPMADWFNYIGSAVAGVNAQLPTLAMNLAAQVGPSGQSITNTASSRSFTYAPTISTTGNVDGPMDLALASSLAGV